MDEAFYSYAKSGKEWIMNCGGTETLKDSLISYSNKDLRQEMFLKMVYSAL